MSGGTVHQVYNQVKYLDRTRFEPHMLTLSSEPEDSLMDLFQQLGILCYSLRLSRLSGLFFAERRIKHFLKTHPLDIICVWGIRAEFFLSLIRPGIPRIVLKYEGFLKSAVISYGPLLGTLINIMQHIAFKRFDGIVCCSEAVYQSARGKIFPDSKVIRNGVDDAIFFPTSGQEKAKLRDNLGLPQNVMIFLSVGYLTKGKDPITVVRGFLESKASEKGLLIFIGIGPLRKKCEKMVEGRENVKFLGQVENVSNYYQASDMFISGSLTEGLPNVVLEGMACGLPGVLSDIPPHREILSLDQKAGLLFLPKAVSELKHRLDEVIDVDLSHRRKAALGIIKNHLNARKIAGQYESFYSSYFVDEKLI